MNSLFSIRRTVRLLLLCAVPLLFLACWYSPVTNRFSRIGVIVNAVIILIFVMVWSWRFRMLWWTLMASCLGLVLFVLSPWTGHYSRVNLRHVYGDKLESYLGTRYVWGGEGRFGIDCSGLIRRGFEEALVTEGVKRMSPALLREGLYLWWHDNTALGIGDGYGGRTRVVTECRSLNELNYDLLRTGDMATNGTHIMAYLGNKEWIGADPSFGKVVKFKIPENNFYFTTSMKIVRWQILENLNGRDAKD